MSRIGKQPISIPSGVNVRYEDRVVHLKGPKGEHAFNVPELIDVEVSDGSIKVQADYMGNTRARSLMGTVQSCLRNMVIGVSEGFTRQLRLVGVGYRANVQGRELELALGFSHPVKVNLPEGINAQVEGNNQITLTGHDNVKLGQLAAVIRAIRPPEPYQGKGVMYEGERIRRKAGKTGKK